MYIYLFPTEFTQFVPGVTIISGTASSSALGAIDGSWLRIEEIIIFGLKNKIIFHTTDKLLYVQEFWQ
jgi:hypothetical protein